MIMTKKIMCKIIKSKRLSPLKMSQDEQVGGCKYKDWTLVMHKPKIRNIFSSSSKATAFCHQWIQVDWNSLQGIFNQNDAFEKNIIRLEIEIRK